MKKYTYTILYISIVILLEINLSSCGSSNKNLNKVNKSNESNIQVSPDVNTAEVSAEIMGYQEKGENLFCKIKVLEVKSIGASIPPLAPGQILNVGIDSSFIEKSKMSEKDILRKNSKHNITVIHFKVPSGIKSTYWKIISIE